MCCRIAGPLGPTVRQNPTTGGRAVSSFRGESSRAVRIGDRPSGPALRTAPRHEEVDRPAISRDEYLSSLPEVKRNLLEAARRLFAQGGFHSLRLDAIAREAKENKAMIRYYFGDKDGLVSAVVESLIHDASLKLVQQAEALPLGDQRVHVYLKGSREIAEDAEQRTSLFDVLPEALREEEFRKQLADLYQWYREINERCLGVKPEMPNYQRLSALAMLVLAATDGLAIQASLDPEKVDIGPAFELLELVVAVGLKFLTPTDWNGQAPTT
jgi:AcrR family transcriptional regulator